MWFKIQDGIMCKLTLWNMTAFILGVILSLPLHELQSGLASAGETISKITLHIVRGIAAVLVEGTWE